MSQFQNSRIPSNRQAFEIQQTENEVTIITRHPGTNEVARIVTFRGQSESESHRWATHRLDEQTTSLRRW